MNKRIFIISLESLEPKLLYQWMKSGNLPNFNRLMQRSKVANLANVEGFTAGSFWPSAITGLNPAGHGRYSISQFSPEKNCIKKRPDDELRAPPFWQHLDNMGHKTCVIDIHRSPLVQLKHGIALCDWMGHHPNTVARSWPKTLVKNLNTQYGEDPYRIYLSELFQKQGEDYFVQHRYIDLADEFLNAVKKRIAIKHSAMLDLYKQKDWDVFLVNFADLHDIGHLFYSIYGNKNIDLANLKGQADPLKRLYQHFDQLLADTLNQISSDLIMLIGGPGMRSIASINPILDCILSRFDENVEDLALKQHGPWEAKSFDKLIEAQGGLVNQLDWKKAAYFTVPNNSNAGAIRVNLCGREAFGVVTADNYDATLADLEEKFYHIKDVDTGLPLVDNVIKVHHDISGKYLSDLPDLLVKWNPKATTRNLYSPIFGHLTWQPNWVRTGDHSRAGIMMVAGEQVEPGVYKNHINPMSFAATIMSLFNIEKPCDGVVLDIFNASG